LTYFDQIYHILVPETSKGGFEGLGVASDSDCSSGNCERELLGKCWYYYSI